MKIENIFAEGDRIVYNYRHTLNSKSSTRIFRKGKFIRVVKRKKEFLADWDANPKCLIKLDVNKNNSTVYKSQIYHDK